MGLLKTIARAPWDLLKPVRERVVFRLLHYGRVLLQPLEAEVRELQARLPASLDALRSAQIATASTLDGMNRRQQSVEDRLCAIEASLSAPGSVDGELAALPAIERRLSALGDIEARLAAIEARVDSARELAEAAARRLQAQGEQVTFVQLGLRAVLRDLGRAHSPGRSLASPGPAGRSPDTSRLFSSASSSPLVVSYARNREDVTLARLFPEDHVGFYVDAGAGDPTVFSVTRLFYDRGWRGINVEPSRPLFDRLMEQRPRDVNLNVGLWDTESELDFHESPGPGGCSSFREEEASRAREQGLSVRSLRMKVAPLAKVLEAWEAPGIDFLRVDAGGAELEVLKGNDWARFRPRVLIVEAHASQARLERAGGSGDEVERLLDAAGYRFATAGGPSRFFVRAEDSEWVQLLAAPAAFDGVVPYEVVAGLEERVRELRALDEALEALHATLQQSREVLGAMLGGTHPGERGDEAPSLPPSVPDSRP